jgi:hypothetical protein
MAPGNAGLKITDMKVIKDHNPFATNDINLAGKLGIDIMRMNNLWCSPITTISRRRPQAGLSRRCWRR